MQGWGIRAAFMVLVTIGSSAAAAGTAPLPPAAPSPAPAASTGPPATSAAAPLTAAPPAAQTTPPSPTPEPAASPVVPPPATLAKVEAVLANALTLVRPGQMGLATVWDGNLWVQCREATLGEILCEAAGTALQPSLAHVVTLERAERLADLAWTVDPRFGNYIHVSAASGAAKSLARLVLRTLAEGYGADLGRVEARSTWVRDTRCPPRNGPRQNLAGSIDDAPAMARTALRGCLYAPAATGPARSAADLFGLYGLRLKGEIQRLIVNNDAPGIHLVLTGKPGYVQCAPDPAPPALYCEAASADAMPALAKVLTPGRIAELHAMGFADPGRAPNYSRTTPLAGTDAGRLTANLLTILYDVYGYKGDPILGIATETGG